MKLTIKGKPYIYTHKCQPDEIGRPLSRTELQEFVIDSLIESYEFRNVNCTRHSEDFNSGADFSYTKLDKTVCCKVIYIADNDDARKVIEKIYDSEHDYFPQLTNGFKKHGSIPLVVLAEVNCLNSEDGENTAGSNYVIEFTPIQILVEDIPCCNKKLSEYELYKGYGKSWESGDSSFFRDYLTATFDAQSDLSFNAITSKAEFLAYFENEYAKRKAHGIAITTRLITDKSDGEHGILVSFNATPKCMLKLRISNFLITESHTVAVPNEYDDWRKVELYQNHGDHHAPFIEDDTQLAKFISDGIKDSVPYLKTETEVCFDENTEKALVFSLACGDPEHCRYMFLIANDSKNGRNCFMSAYPFLDGENIAVRVLEVYEWDNKLEATIRCCYESLDKSFEFCFFATDYYFNKSLYQIGNRIEIGLAASSSNVKIASKGFSFEGQKALDFLAKIGKEPEYDEDGKVMPLNFSTEKLVAFLSHDDKCPDEAEFQSPAYNDGCDYVVSPDNIAVGYRMIKICSDPEIEIPLYFNQDCNPEQYEPITGWLWLTGRISCFNYSSDNYVSRQVLSATRNDFYEEIKGIDLSTPRDMYMLFRHLNKLGIKPNSNICLAKIVNDDSFYYKLYSSTTDDGLAVKVIDEQKVYSLPSVLDVLTVENSINGVWDAFLLYNIEDLLPKYGRYVLPKHYILTKKDVRDRKNMLSLLPNVKMNKQGAGTIVVHYYNKGGDLMRDVYTFILYNGKISIEPDATYFISDAPNDLLFRD